MTVDQLQQGIIDLGGLNGAEPQPQVGKIAAEAIQQGQEGSFIYVVQADKSVQPKAVTVAATQGRRVAVSGGVAAGDTVVTDGQLRLTPGTKIEAVAEPAAGAAAASAAFRSEERRAGTECRSRWSPYH